MGASGKYKQEREKKQEEHFFWIFGYIMSLTKYLEELAEEVLEEERGRERVKERGEGSKGRENFELHGDERQMEEWRSEFSDKELIESAKNGIVHD